MYSESGLASPAPSSSSSLMSGTSDWATLSSRTGRSKRHATEVDYAALEVQGSANGDERPSKRRAPRSTAAEKQARKVARMERNRIAAQVSRDKKKQQQELLEARIHQLEDQLAHRDGTPAPMELTPAPMPLLLPDPHEVDQLKEENETLKTQLALEKLHSQSLQIRLVALETKFSRLEQLLDKSTLLAPESSSVGGVAAQPQEQPETKATRGRFIPAAEAVLPPPVDSCPSFSPPLCADFTAVGGGVALTPPASDFSPFSLDLDYGLTLDSGVDGLELDLVGGAGLGSSTEPASSAGLDSSPLFGVDDCATGFGAPLFSESDVNQAWLDWSLGVESTSASASNPVAVDQPSNEFDLVAFLRDHQQDPRPISFAADALAC